MGDPETVPGCQNRKTQPTQPKGEELRCGFERRCQVDFAAGAYGKEDIKGYDKASVNVAIGEKRGPMKLHCAIGRLMEGKKKLHHRRPQTVCNFQ